MSKAVYETVTAGIIEQLEKGCIPWVKPWKADSSADKNIDTQNAYRGVNRLILGMSSMAKGYSVPVWGTYDQWQKKGANVRKGEKGTQIIKYQPMAKGKDKDTGEDIHYNLIKAYWVFNAAQVDGIEITAPETTEKPFNAVEQAEQRIVKTGALISYGGDAAFYAPSQDRIQLPHKSAFLSESNYYATAFHELVHWSGHESRCNRDLKGRYGNPAYAFEELVAEMGAAFLCSDYAIQGELRHASYIESWLKACRDDSKAIFKAAALAQKAVDFINGLDATSMPVAA